MNMNSKEKVPQTLRNTIWKKRFGKSNTGVCVCCTFNDIDQSTFQCGHIQSRTKGGQIHKDNLEPICSACNKSIGSKHMFEFMAKYGYSPPPDQKELCEIFDDYLEAHKKTKSAKEPKRVIKKEVVFYEKPEIESCVGNILEKFKNDEREVQVIAPTQSGKSDIIINLINKIVSDKKKYRMEYNFDKVVIIICASDKDLKRDLSEKINKHIENHIMITHLPDIMNFAKNQKDANGWEDKKDCALIIFDENHCDLAEHAIVDNFRNVMGIGWSKWTNDDVKVLGLSATPYEHIRANIPYVEMKPNKQYYSIENMMANKRIKQSYDLSDYDNVSKLFRYKSLYLKKGYCIIRLPARSKKIVKSNIKEFMKNKKIKHKTITYDMKDEEDINVSVLCNKPDNLVIIYVKDKIRKGKTLKKEYILMMHDREKTKHTSSTIQGLLGRGTGFDANMDMMIYCDLEHVKKHLDWVKNKYDNDHVPESHYLFANTLKRTPLKYMIEDEKSDSDDAMSDTDYDTLQQNTSDGSDDELKKILKKNITHGKKLPSQSKKKVPNKTSDSSDGTDARKQRKSRTTKR